MQRELLDCSPDVAWTYDLLAAVIYDSIAPTRSQLSAIARAARRLNDHQHARIEPSSWDARVNVVLHADPVDHVEQLMSALPAGAVYSYEKLAASVYWNAWPTPTELSATKRAVQQLAEQGRARVLNASEDAAGRPYLTATPAIRST